MGDCLRRAYDEAERAASRGDSNATPTRQGVADLKAENAKLRELVSNCHGWLVVNCEKGYVIPRNGLDAIEQSMRDLGMEVDG